MRNNAFKELNFGEGNKRGYTLKCTLLKISRFKFLKLPRKAMSEFKIRTNERSRNLGDELNLGF